MKKLSEAKIAKRLRGISDCIVVDLAGTLNEHELINRILTRIRPFLKPLAEARGET